LAAGSSSGRRGAMTAVSGRPLELGRDGGGRLQVGRRSVLFGDTRAAWPTNTARTES
jgi:hypothetical protein